MGIGSGLRPLRAAGILLGGYAFGLAGCAARPASVLPAPDTPDGFHQRSADAPVRWPTRDWYREFGSARLDALIAAASHDNLDLAAARARMLEADARAREAHAAMLPALEATGGGTYYAGHSAAGGGHELDWSALLSASYELDFWGKHAAEAQSAGYLARASRAAGDIVELGTLAAVASTYFQVQALTERIAIAGANREAAHTLLEVMRARFEAGLIGPEELAAQRATWDNLRIEVADLEASRAEAASILAVLVGRPPQSLDLGAEPLASLAEPRLGAGLPSELLVRRPDIAEAEANLRAAHADVAAARAAMLPSISLTAGGGVGNPALPATVLTIPGIGPTLALGGNLTQPIFDHGRLRAQRDEAMAREQSLLAEYRKAILSAFADTENALASLVRLDESREPQADHLLQSERAFQAAQARYRIGSGDFVTLLEAQRSVYAAREQAVEYRLSRLQGLVSLCKALGGGWSDAARTASNRAAGPVGAAPGMRR